LLLMGEHFQYTPYAPKLAERIRRGRCEVIEGGRFCMVWERADDIARKTIEFVG